MNDPYPHTRLVCKDRGLAEALKALSAYVDLFETKEKAADDIGVSRVFLWKMINGKKPISDKVLEKIGFEKIVTKTTEYRKVK